MRGEVPAHESDAGAIGATITSRSRSRSAWTTSGAAALSVTMVSTESNPHRGNTDSRPSLVWSKQKITFFAALRESGSSQPSQFSGHELAVPWFWLISRPAATRKETGNVQRMLLTSRSMTEAMTAVPGFCQTAFLRGQLLRLEVTIGFGQWQYPSPGQCYRVA